MKILGLQVQCENVGQDGVHGSGNVFSRRGRQVGRREKWRLLPVLEALDLSCVGAFQSPAKTGVQTEDIVSITN